MRERLYANACAYDRLAAHQPRVLAPWGPTHLGPPPDPVELFDLCRLEENHGAAVAAVLAPAAPPPVLANAAAAAVLAVAALPPVLALLPSHALVA